MIEIPLTRGAIAIIDDEDADLAQFNWCLAKSGYPKRIGPRPARKTILLHRVIGFRMETPAAGLVLDHIDGDTLNCRRSNLRWVTQSENMHNRRVGRSNTSGYMGVHFSASAGKWQATIFHQGRSWWLGNHDTPEAANAARLRGERELWGIAPRRAEVHQCA